MTVAVYIFVSLLLAAALVRRPQALTVILAVSFGLSVVSAQYAHGDSLRSVLMGLDGFTVIAAWLLWKTYLTERAALIAVIGTVKICFGIAAATVGLSSLVWASGNNALFIVQVLIAGGFANGFMAWLGRGRNGAHVGWRGLLGYMERLP